MEYIYYKAKKGNFGDDLNGWLWPKLFGETVSDNYLIGVGSLLHNESLLIDRLKDSNKKKIVFGTGVKPSKIYSNLKLKGETWDVKFLRGPLSSASLDNKYSYIADAAYAMRQISTFDTYSNVTKKYEISLMPYFHSVDYIDWKSICKQLGYNYISPLSEKGVEHTIQEIASSKLLITEAMHGAIVSDILRVPWHRFIFSTPHTEGERISDFKWNDWSESINIINQNITYIPFFKKSKIHKITKVLSMNILSIEYLPLLTLRSKIINKLSNIKDYYLSKDKIIENIDDKIFKKVKEVLAEN